MTSCLKHPKSKPIFVGWPWWYPPSLVARYQAEEAAAPETLGTKAAGYARTAASNLYGKMPGREEVAKTLLTEGAREGIDDEIGSEEPPPGNPPPPSNTAAENADEYSRNFAALYGDNESGVHPWG